MKVRFLIFGTGNTSGGLRSVVNQANTLADDHDVEIYSVFKRRPSPFPLHPRVKTATLLPGNSVSRRFYERLARYPSRYVPAGETRYKDFSLGTDMLIRRWMGRLDGGVLIGTRPALNVLIARFGPRSVVRIGEDHMNFRSYKPSLATAIARWYPRLDAVTVLTQPDAKEYTEALGPEARVEHIPNQVPPADRPPAPLSEKVVVAAGRLTRQKGFDMLVDAFAQVTKQYPEWRLRIFGEGPLRRQLAERIADSGAADNITLRGKTVHFEEELRSAAFYVLSSRFEGLPMTILEAMTQGLPVVAFNCHTGPGDVITDGHDGLLVPPNDTTALAGRIIELIANDERRRALGAHAYESARRFHPDTIGPRWQRLFTDLGAR